MNSRDFPVDLSVLPVVSKRKRLRKVASKQGRSGACSRTKLFIKITNGRGSSPGKRQVENKERRRVEDESDSDSDSPEMERRKGDTVIELTPTGQSVAPSSSTQIPTVGLKKPEPFINRMSEKATKYLNRKKIGKLFGEKEADITVFTIDREMSRDSQTKVAELSEALKRTKQAPVAPQGGFRSIGCLASEYPPHRLIFFPPDDWRTESLLTTVTNLILSQCTIAALLLLWIIFGSLVFYLTEGPYESEQVNRDKQQEKSLILSLATDLRLVTPKDQIWKETIDKYFMLHKELITQNISSFGLRHLFWTFSGSFMFCISLVTTLGLAAPLPTSTGGCVGAFIFTLIGFPLNLIFLTHLSRLIGVKVQIFVKELENKLSNVKERIMNVRRFGEDLPREADPWPEKMFLIDFKPSPHLKYIPFVTTLLYYGFGVLVFGWARGADLPHALFFWLDFSTSNPTAGGLAKVGFGWFLEGAAVLTAVNAVIWRDSPIKTGFSNWGIHQGFLTNCLD